LWNRRMCLWCHDESPLIDVGLQNQELLSDNLYLGLRQPRARGEKYDEFVDNFVKAARNRFPNAYIHL
jgi:malate dehydrogenase (oxaloacetate-decarboxylating)